MQATTATGTKFEVEISGFQEEPIITMPAQTIKGMKFGGKGQIAASQKRTKPGVPAITDSLCFQAGGKNVFLQMDLTPIRAAIAALPRKVKMARTVTETRDLDGDRYPISVWQFDGVCVSPKTGNYIPSEQMGKFLASKGISEIEISEACQMWTAAKESDEQIVRRAEESRKFAAIERQWADEEDMESAPRDPTPEYPREG